jgi:hypothetical protein
MKAYSANRRRAAANVLEGDPAIVALRAFMTSDDEALEQTEEGPQWHGTATQLLELLSAFVGEKQAKAKDWPGSARALRSRLDRFAAALRKSRISTTYGGRGHRGGTLITIRYRRPEKGGTTLATLASHKSQ